MITKREKRWVKDMFKNKYDLARVDGDLTICGYEGNQYCIFGYSGEICGVNVYSPVCPIGNAAKIFVLLENKTILELEEMLKLRK